MSPSSGYVTELDPDDPPQPELDPDDPPQPELDNLEVSTKYTFALFELKFIFKNTSFH